MHQNHHLFNFLRNRELDELYACMGIRAFALGMINIFIPIYLYKTGYSLTQIFIFFALVSLVHALSAIPSGFIANRIGFKHTILLSLPILIFAYMVLYSLESFNWPLIVPAFLLGFNSSLFWTSYHTDFSKYSKPKDRGKSVGFAGMLFYLFAIGGPLIGGLILTKFGFNVWFIVASGILIMSSVPLFFSQDFYESGKTFSVRGVFKRSKTDLISFAGQGLEAGVWDVIWPLFVFLFIVESFTMLGFVASLSLLFSALFVMVIGFASDVRRRLILTLGAVFHAMIWIGKTAITSLGQVFFIDSAHGATRTMSRTPYHAMIYDKANQSNILEYIIAREVMFHMSKVAFFIAMVFIGDLVLGFWIGSFGALLYILI